MRVKLYTADGPARSEGALQTLSSTSVYGGCCPASIGRLDFAAGEAWCGCDSADLGTYYLQIDLDSAMEITGVATQGNIAFNEGTAIWPLVFNWGHMGRLQ